VSVHVHETDRVKKGQKWFLVENKSESEHISLSKLELYEANADCKPLSEILRYCSLEEQSYGCVYKNGSTFLLEFEKSGVSLTPLLNATDGCYVAIYIFSNNSKVKKKFQVGLNGKYYYLSKVMLKWFVLRVEGELKTTYLFGATCVKPQ